MSPEPDRRKLIQVAIVQPEVRGNLLDGRVEKALEVAKREFPETEIDLDEEDIKQLKSLKDTGSLGKFTARARRRGIINKE